VDRQNHRQTHMYRTPKHYLLTVYNQEYRVIITVTETSVMCNYKMFRLFVMSGRSGRQRRQLVETTASDHAVHVLQK